MTIKVRKNRGQNSYKVYDSSSGETLHLFDTREEALNKKKELLEQPAEAEAELKQSKKSVRFKENKVDEDTEIEIDDTQKVMDNKLKITISKKKLSRKSKSPSK